MQEVIYRIILEGIARIGQSCLTAANSDISSNTMNCGCLSEVASLFG
jgi:hypothetical protein